MKKILLIIATLSLAGCSTGFGQRLNDTIGIVQNFTITQNQVDAARNSYDGLVLAPMAKYAKLPLCKLGQKLTLNNPCHDRVLLKKLRNVDKEVAKAFDDVQSRIGNGDNAGLGLAYNTLMNAIDIAKSLISQTGISVLGG